MLLIVTGVAAWWEPVPGPHFTRLGTGDVKLSALASAVAPAPSPAPRFMLRASARSSRAWYPECAMQ